VYVIAYSAMYIGLMTPVISTLALKVLDIVGEEGKIGALSLVTGIGALFAFFSNPICGALSDHTTSKLGMRRPWLIGGAVGGGIGLLMIAMANQLWMVVVGWALTQGCFNAAQAAFQAILPDQIPESSRAKVSGFLGAGQQLAPLIGIALANFFSAQHMSIAVMIIVPAAISVAGVLWMAIVLKDRHLSKAEAGEFHLGAFLKSFWVSPKKFPDFAWAFAGRFLLFLGFACYNAYQMYYLKDRFGFDATEALSWQLRLMILQTVILVLFSTVGGMISDKTGRRKIFVIVATLLIGVALAIFATATNPNLLYVAAAIFGAAFGAYMAVDLALVTDVLPNKETEAAKNMGVFNIANALPQSLAPAIAPFFLAIGAAPGVPNYTSLFLIAALIAVAGAVTTMFIRGAK
jgi:MFS family permease